MQAMSQGTQATVTRSHNGPWLDSYDSGEEFSLCHWTEVCNLVEAGDAGMGNEGLPTNEEIEEALEETMSEVEPATAYQNFAGDVV